MGKIYLLEELNYQSIGLLMWLIILLKDLNNYLYYIFPFIFVQMINKTEYLYYEILIFIFKYITENFDETKLELKTFCTDFEVALI